MPLSVCTITGTAYYANGSLGDANIYITADQVTLNGSVIGSAAQDFYAEPVGGVITLILPRGSTARLYGNVRGFHDAIVVAIPDTATADLEDLIPVQYSGSLPQGLGTGSSPTFDDLTLTGLLNGVKVYRALLTQTGVSPPVAVVLENSLGGTLVWTRLAGGRYNATLAGAFLVGKAWYNGGVISNGNEFTGLFGLSRTDNNALRLVTTPANDASTPADDILAATPVEILVYP